jgi:Fic family protein
LLVSLLPKTVSSILGKEQAEQSVLVLLELFQYPRILQHLCLQIVDLSVARLFHRDIIRKAHATIVRQRAHTNASEEDDNDNIGHAGDDRRGNDADDVEADGVNVNGESDKGVRQG